MNDKQTVAIQDEQLFSIEELEARFEMEVVAPPVPEDPFRCECKIEW